MKKTVLEYQNEGYFDMEKIPQWCIMDGYVNQEINLNYFRMVDEKDELDKSHRITVKEYEG